MFVQSLITCHAAAAGYSANLTIDSNAVTEEWVGGSAPSEGGSDDYYLHHTIICIGRQVILVRHMITQVTHRINSMDYIIYI